MWNQKLKHLPLYLLGSALETVTGGQQTQRSTARALLLKTGGWRVWVGVPGLEETTYTVGETRPLAGADAVPGSRRVFGQVSCGCDPLQF